MSILSKAGKRFALLLNDDITDLDFKLASNYSDDRLLRSIKEIVGTFYAAAFLLLMKNLICIDPVNFHLSKTKLNEEE